MKELFTFCGKVITPEILKEEKQAYITKIKEALNQDGSFGFSVNKINNAYVLYAFGNDDKDKILAKVLLETEFRYFLSKIGSMNITFEYKLKLSKDAGASKIVFSAL